jgi:hypothetical protein
MSPHGLLATGHHLLGVAFTTNQNSNLRTAVTTQNTEQKVVLIRTYKTQLRLSATHF